MSDPTITCDRCSSVAPAGASTCPNCGAPLGGAGETIVTGYETRKLEDPEAEATRIVPEPAPVYPASEVHEAAKTARSAAPEAEPAAAYAAPAASAAFDLPPAAPQTPAEKPPASRSPWLWVGGVCAVILVCCMCLPLCVSLVYYLATGSFNN